MIGFGLARKWFLLSILLLGTSLVSTSARAANSCQRIVELLTSPVKIDRNLTLKVTTQNHFSNFEIVYETRPIVPTSGKFYFLVYDGPVIVRPGNLIQESQRHVRIDVGDYQTKDGYIIRNWGRLIYRDSDGDDYPVVTPETYQRYKEIVAQVHQQAQGFLQQFPEIPALGDTYRFISNDRRLQEAVVHYHPRYSTTIMLQEDRDKNRALVLDGDLNPIGYVLPQSWSLAKSMLTLNHKLTLYEFWTLYGQWSHMRKLGGMEVIWQHDADAAVFEAGRRNYRKSRLQLSDTESAILKQLVLSGRRYAFTSYDFGILTAEAEAIENTLTAAGRHIGRLFSRNQIDQVVNHFMRFPNQYTRENLIELLVSDVLPAEQL